MRAVVALLVFSCAGHGDRAEPAGGPTPPSLPSSPAQDAMTPPPPSDVPTLVREPLPSPFDVRVTRVLDQPLPDDVALEVAIVAMGKLPSGNRRVQVHVDGGVHAVARGTGGDWQVPFDRPLPDAPGARVAPDELDGWLTALDQAGFFQHPGYEANPRAQDGTFVIVRARRGGSAHAVVYQNVRPAPIAAVVDAVAAAAGR